MRDLPLRRGCGGVGGGSPGIPRAPAWRRSAALPATSTGKAVDTRTRNKPVAHPSRLNHTRRPGASGAWRGLAVCALVLGVLALCGLGRPWAAEASVEQVYRLLSEEPAVRLQALSVLRQEPEQARESLLEVLPAQEAGGGRWRLIHHLAEFGRTEDIPRLMALLADTTDPRERETLRGVVRALHTPAPANADLSRVAQDFSFVQTTPPRQLADAQRGQWRLTDWSFAEMHRANLPIAVIRALEPLRGRGYPSREAAAEAMQHRLNDRRWRRHGEALAGWVEQDPTRVRLEGTVQARVGNLLDVPLLLEVTVDVWFADAAERPPRPWVYLLPGQSRQVELPLVLRGPESERGARLDLRVAQVEGGIIPTYYKLYLPLLP